VRAEVVVADPIIELSLAAPRPLERVVGVDLQEEPPASRRLLLLGSSCERLRSATIDATVDELAGKLHVTLHGVGIAEQSMTPLPEGVERREALAQGTIRVGLLRVRFGREYFLEIERGERR